MIQAGHDKKRSAGLIAASLVVAWWWVARNENVQPQERKSLKEVALAFKDGIWTLGMPASVGAPT